jgi:hypothetical protein
MCSSAGAVQNVASNARLQFLLGGSQALYTWIPAGSQGLEKKVFVWAKAELSVPTISFMSNLDQRR